MATILMVDDDPDILKIGKRILSAAGYDVLTALNAREACELLNQMAFDMIISDANMPQHSGFDLLKVLRHDSRFKHLPIALLTARREKKDIQHAIELGVDDYIVKPIDPMLLIKKVQALFEKKPPVQRASFDLKEVTTHHEGSLLFPTTVLNVSEVGVVVESTFELVEGQTLNLQSEIFSEIRIPAPKMKVLSCDYNRAQKAYRARLVFTHLEDSSLQKIRAWILRQEETVRRAS